MKKIINLEKDVKKTVPIVEAIFLVPAMIIGIILVIALLSAPAAISALFSKNLKNRMILSILIGIVFSFCGIWISYELDISSGATIIILLTSIYFILNLLFSILNKKTNHFYFQSAYYYLLVVIYK